MSFARSDVALYAILLHHLFVGVLFTGAGALAVVWHTGTWSMPSSLQGVHSLLQGPAAWPLAASLIAVGATHLACARSLWRARSLGRTLAMLLAVLHLPLLPIGTAIAGVTFWAFRRPPSPPEEADPSAPSPRDHDHPRWGCALLLAVALLALSVVATVGYVVFSAVQNVMETLHAREAQESERTKKRGLSELGLLDFFAEFEQLKQEAAAGDALSITTFDDALNADKMQGDVSRPGAAASTRAPAPESVGTLLPEVKTSTKAPTNAQEEEGTWRYVDGAGNLHIVDHYLKVPQRHRKDAVRMLLE